MSMYNYAEIYNVFCSCYAQSRGSDWDNQLQARNHPSIRLCSVPQIFLSVIPTVPVFFSTTTAMPRLSICLVGLSCLLSNAMTQKYLVMLRNIMTMYSPNLLVFRRACSLSHQISHILQNSSGFVVHRKLI